MKLTILATTVLLAARFALADIETNKPSDWPQSIVVDIPGGPLAGSYLLNWVDGVEGLVFDEGNTTLLVTPQPDEYHYLGTVSSKLFEMQCWGTVTSGYFRCACPHPDDTHLQFQNIVPAPEPSSLLAILGTGLLMLRRKA